MKTIKLEYYVTTTGKSPFVKWMKSLAVSSRVIVLKRLARIEAGNFGDGKSIKGVRGVYELRIHEGPGYRVYYVRKGDTLVILLCGGKKGSQALDISKAKTYWKDYLENNED